MGWVLRTSSDRVNPTLPGGVYGHYITAGRGVFWYFDGARVRFILFISDGGRYGMDSSAIKLSYKGADIAPADFKFHPGTFTKQIECGIASSINLGTNTINANNHLLANGNIIRFGAGIYSLPAPLSPEITYYVVNSATNSFQVSLTLGGAAIDLTGAGTGTVRFWRANAGWDDPDQGLPAFCPQTRVTFSGICYVEGKLPPAYNTNIEPDWQDFRVEGLGRKLMNYDAGGNELGVISGNAQLLCNPALAAADCLIVDYNKPLSRIDFPSLIQLKDAAPVLVWQRTDTSSRGTSWIGKYYNYAGSVPPDINAATLVLTRRDATLDFDFASASPAAGVGVDFIAVWECMLKPKYSETYTFLVTRDNGARIYLNEVLLYNHWTNDTAADQAFTHALTANQPVKIRVEYFDGGGPGKFTLKWQSASLPSEVVPMERAYESDQEIPRAEINTAAATPVEASDYFEQIIEKIPGWDWTDINGKITFLPPDRPIAYEFMFDAEDPDQENTFLDGTFEKQMRHRRERPNFRLWSYRNRLYTGFPEGFVEENRPRLRELGNGMPNNDPPDDLMVMHEGQAKRVAEVIFKRTSDPTHTLSLSSRKAAGVAAKCQFVRVRNWVKGDKRIEDSICEVKSVNRQGNKLDFTLLPIPYPFHTDEPVDGGGDGDGVGDSG